MSISDKHDDAAKLLYKHYLSVSTRSLYFHAPLKKMHIALPFRSIKEKD